jgi:hypothetical protein
MEAGTKHKAHPKLVGDQAEAMVIARLVQAEKTVLLPFGENQRYDIVLDEGDRFVRIQCKTGRLRNGAINFPTCSTSYHHPNNRGTIHYRHTYSGQVDMFGVYCPETDGVYLVPVAGTPGFQASLRLAQSKNNQSKRVRWARDYELRPPG